MHTGCVFVAGIHSSRSSGSFASLQWNACVHRLDLGLYSHPKEFWGNGVRTHVKSKGQNPLHREKKPLPRGGSNPRRCIKQDSEPNTLPTSYSDLQRRGSNSVPFPYRVRLAGLVVKASASGAEDPELESRLRRDFSGSSQTSDLNIDTPVATLPGACPAQLSVFHMERRSRNTLVISTVIIMKSYHRRRTCSHTSPRRSPTMVTLHDTRFVEC